MHRNDGHASFVTTCKGEERVGVGGKERKEGQDEEDGGGGLAEGKGCRFVVVRGEVEWGWGKPKPTNSVPSRTDASRDTAVHPELSFPTKKKLRAKKKNFNTKIYQ